MSRELFEAQPPAYEIDLRVRRLESRVARLEELVTRLSSDLERLSHTPGHRADGAD